MTNFSGAMPVANFAGSRMRASVTSSSFAVRENPSESSAVDRDAPDRFFVERLDDHRRRLQRFGLLQSVLADDVDEQLDLIDVARSVELGDFSSGYIAPYLARDRSHPGTSDPLACELRLEPLPASSRLISAIVKSLPSQCLPGCLV
jgi:hypothetical protein